MLNNENSDVMTGGSLWDVNDLTLGTGSFNIYVAGRANKMELSLQQVALCSMST